MIFMAKLAKGIRRIGRELPYPRKNLLVMHPYYHGIDEAHYNLSDEGVSLLWGEETRDYVSNLQRLFQNLEGNLIVLEEKPSLEWTGNHLAQFSSSGIYLVPTLHALPIPRAVRKTPEKEWNHLAEFLKTIKGDFFFAGGYLHSPNGNCLGILRDELAKRGVSGKFVYGCCFR